MFTNDIRKSSAENSVEVHSEIVTKLQNHCQFANVVISLPFLTLKDTDLNTKIENCNILMKYRFLNSSSVQICENSALYNKGVAVRKFIAQDGIHMSNHELKVYISNMKYFIRRSLGLAISTPKKSFGQFGQRQERPSLYRKQYGQNNRMHSYPTNESFGLNFPPQYNHPQFSAFVNPPFFSLDFNGF